MAAVNAAYQARQTANPCQIRLCQGTPGVLLDELFDPDWAIEAFVEWNDALHDDEADRLMNASEDQKAELRRDLAAAFRAWRQRHDLGRPLPRETPVDEILSIHLDTETHPC
jgi:hypothetical protein